MCLFFLTFPKPLKQYTLFNKRLSNPLSNPEVSPSGLKALCAGSGAGVLQMNIYEKNIPTLELIIIETIIL
jgi:hypothetical protein